MAVLSYSIDVLTGWFVGDTLHTAQLCYDVKCIIFLNKWFSYYYSWCPWCVHIYIVTVWCDTTAACRGTIQSSSSANVNVCLQNRSLALTFKMFHWSCLQAVNLSGTMTPFGLHNVTFQCLMKHVVGCLYSHKVLSKVIHWPSMLSRLSQKMARLSLTINLHVSESHSHLGLVDGQGKVINKKILHHYKIKKKLKNTGSTCAD